MGMVSICEKCNHNGVCGYQDDATLACSDFQKEVVRCKDCKLWLGGGYLSRGRCKKWSAPVASITPFTGADDFCSYGERKGDGNG